MGHDPPARLSTPPRHSGAPRRRVATATALGRLPGGCTEGQRVSVTDAAGGLYSYFAFQLLARQTNFRALLATPLPITTPNFGRICRAVFEKDARAMSLVWYLTTAPPPKYRT